MLRLRKESPCVSIAEPDLSDTLLLSFPEESRVTLIHGVCVCANFDYEHVAAGGCGLCLGAHCLEEHRGRRHSLSPWILRQSRAYWKQAKMTAKHHDHRWTSLCQTRKDPTKEQETRTTSQRMGRHDLNTNLGPKKVHGDSHDRTSPTATAQATRTNGAHHDDDSPLILKN